VAVLQRIRELRPDADLVVVTAREMGAEPAYVSHLEHLCREYTAPVLISTNPEHPEHEEFWEQNPLDLALLVHWRWMLPTSFYARMPLGAYVFHDSLLPKYRGFSPTTWALINGESEVGATLFRIAERIDSGPIIDQEPVSIGSDETIREVFPRVTEAYLRILERTLDPLLAGTAPCRQQEEAEATYTCKRFDSDNRIDWRSPSRDIYNLVRALTRPYPGAHTYLDGIRLLVWRAECVSTPVYVGRVPGRVVSASPGEGALVCTGEGMLRLLEVQEPNEAEAAEAGAYFDGSIATLT
jgi:methionyl-tRNA formyltransferase